MKNILYTALFVYFIYGSTAMSQNTEYSNEYLINFITQSMKDSISNKWHSAKMEGKVSLTNTGKKDIQAVYTYKQSETSEDIQFSVANTFGPLNAMSYLKDNMSKEGNVWSNMSLTIYQNGKHTLQVK